MFKEGIKDVMKNINIYREDTTELIMNSLLVIGNPLLDHTHEVPASFFSAHSLPHDGRLRPFPQEVVNELTKRFKPIRTPGGSAQNTARAATVLFMEQW